MKVILTFFVIFVAGPVLYMLLTRREPTRHYINFLRGIAVGFVLISFATMHWIVPAYAPNPLPGLSAVIAMWIAWVTVLSLCVLMILPRFTSRTAQNTTFALGAMATTLPWFGLFAAQVVTGR